MPEEFFDTNIPTGLELGKALDLFTTDLSDVIKLRAGEHNIKEWVESHRILYGKPFSYKNAEIRMELGKNDKQLEIAPRPYLDKYLNDRSLDKSIIKCRQSEFTESEVNENLYLCSVEPYFRIVHLFPTGKMVQTMSREKITPAIDKSPLIKQLMANPNQQAQQEKEFLNGSFYRLESSWTDRGGRGPSCDKITFDEYESQNPEIEEVFSESTSHSKYGRRTRISTPMVPNMGIDAKYQAGCKFVWRTKCPKCKTEQEMAFPDNIIGYFDKADYAVDDIKYLNKLHEAYIGCKFCGAYLDRASRFYLKNSLWIAEKPQLINIKNSYKVSYFMLPWKTGKEILKKYHEFRYVHQFYNEIIGIPFIAEDANIGKDIIEQCENRNILNQCKFFGWYKNVSIGVDWGLTSWVVVRAQGHPSCNKRGAIIYVERIDDKLLQSVGLPINQESHKQRLEQLAHIFHADIIINDANGLGVDRNAYLIKMFPTKAWGCFYDTDENEKQRKRLKLITPAWHETKRTVTVSRLGEHRAALTELRSLDINIPLRDLAVQEFVDQVDNIIVEKLYDAKRDVDYEVISKKGDDHFGHANVYSKIGFDQILSVARPSPGVI